MPFVPFVPSTPFSASLAAAAHSPAAMVSLAPALNAVAVVTHSGFTPVGMVAVQPLLRPVIAPVANVYVTAADGRVGVLAARW